MTKLRLAGILILGMVVLMELIISAKALWAEWVGIPSGGTMQDIPGFALALALNTGAGTLELAESPLFFVVVIPILMIWHGRKPKKQPLDSN